jgi:hypothetical protein
MAACCAPRSGQSDWNLGIPRCQPGHRRVHVPCPGGQREHRVDWAFPNDGRDIRPGHEGGSATMVVADELAGRLPW